MLSNFTKTHFKRLMLSIGDIHAAFHNLAADFKTPLNQGNIFFTFGLTIFIVLMGFILSWLVQKEDAESLSRTNQRS